MAAPKGNTFFKNVVKPTGAPRAYSPDEIWQKAVEYAEWVQQTPLWELKAFANGKTKSVPKMRPMSEIGFCNFADISRQTWADYKSGKDQYKDFSDITARICSLFYQQKFEGAAADLLNPNIISRDLGLVDKQDVTSKGKQIATPAVVLNLPEGVNIEFPTNTDGEE